MVGLTVTQPVEDDQSIAVKGVLNFEAKLFQPSHKPAISSYVQTRRTDGPLVVELDPTTACNMSCPECISADLLNQDSIGTQRLTELIDEFAEIGVKGVVFIGGGEPLAHKSMPQPIIQCRQRGMSVGITTNGTLIDRHLDAIAEHANWTRVSLDGGTQDTFSRFRPSKIRDSFSRILRSMECLSKQKVGILGVSYLVMERLGPDGRAITSNVEEVYAAAHIAKEVGCDYFEWKPMVDMAHELVPLSESARNSLLMQKERMAELSDDSFAIIAPESMPLLLKGKSSRQPKTYTKCPTLELRTVVTPSGIYACPYKRGHPKARLGDVGVPFSDFWQSNKRREAADSINPSQHCGFFCIKDSMNQLLLAIASSYDEGVDLLPFMTSSSSDVFI